MILIMGGRRNRVSMSKTQFATLLRQVKAAGFEECRKAVTHQGVVQLPANPYSEEAPAHNG